LATPAAQDLLKEDEDEGEAKEVDEKVVNGMMDELNALLNPNSTKRLVDHCLILIGFVGRL